MSNAMSAKSSPMPVRGSLEYFQLKSCVSKSEEDTEASSEMSMSAGSSSSPAIKRNSDPTINGGQLMSPLSLAHVAICAIDVQLATWSGVVSRTVLNKAVATAGGGATADPGVM